MVCDTVCPASPASSIFRMRYWWKLCCTWMPGNELRWLIHRRDFIIFSSRINDCWGKHISYVSLSPHFSPNLSIVSSSSRNLDFIEDGNCCSCDDTLADIKQYCQNPKRSEHVLKVNLPKDRPTNKTSKNLTNALKTVEDLHAQSVRFQTIVQLGIFLDPFVHLERLSIEWPGQVIKIGTNLDTIRNAWRAPFSRLRYLSVTLSDGTCVTQLLACLHVCQELKELHIIDQSTSPWTSPDLHNVKLEQLKNLEIVVFSGWCEPDYRLYHCIMDLFTDSEEWIKLTIAYSDNKGFYFRTFALSMLIQ